MSKLIIRGGKPLFGNVRVGGRKNSALAVIPATLMGDGPSILENIPDIADVNIYLNILRDMGVKVDRLDSNTLSINPDSMHTEVVPEDRAKKIRASYYLLGALLAKKGRVEVALPGGCDIGLRPIDQHIKGLKALGAKVEVEHGAIVASADKLIGTNIYLDVVSVGATANIILAAVFAEGTTVIENAAKEPHIVDLANYLNAMGARVVGAGTDVIKIKGVEELHGATHAIIPDEIEAATFMMAAAATRGDVTIENIIPKHLDPITAKLREAGVEIEENGDKLRVIGKRRPSAVNVKTIPYPGFPTDAQQPMTAFLSISQGTSIVSETVWEGRFKHVDELQRMGTKIKVEGRTAIIEGVGELTGAPVRATDLRAGAALLIAGLIAKGETELSGVEHIERGYENVAAKFKDLGGDITKETVVETEEVAK